MSFIVFEGPDGSGQTTQTKMLSEYLKNNNYKVFETKEPTNDTLIGKMIREILQNKHKVSEDTLQLLFVADRAEHLHSQIEKRLDNKEWVVCDRYIMSTLAFGSASGVSLDWLKKLNEKFIWPKYTFLLDVPAEVCIERISKTRGTFEYFEKKEKLEKILKRYKEIAAERSDVFVIDGTQTKEEIHESVKKILKI